MLLQTLLSCLVFFRVSGAPDLGVRINVIQVIKGQSASGGGDYANGPAPTDGPNPTDGGGGTDLQNFSSKVTDGPAPTDGPNPTDGGGGDCNCDYSTFSSSHTMNKYTGPDGSCGAYHKTGVTDEEIKTILKTHNDLRQKVAKGDEDKGSPGPQPGATNMFELKWNCELAEVAQRWAEQCKLGHDKGDDRKICNQDYYVGQNAFMEWHYLADSAWEKAINNWYGEVKDMPKSLVDSFGSHPTGKVIGHYTQVVWAGTYEIGCGGIHFPATLGSTTYEQSKVYVCNYGVGGNFLGSKIYESGSAATNCPNGVSTDYPGLCVPPS